MYYGIVSFAVLLFSLMFYFNQRYERENGCSFQATMVFMSISSLAGLLALLIINGFHVTATPFLWIMAVVDTTNNLLFTICSMKALSKINLSLYSLFSMLGGMTIPFVAGILFYHEAFTPGKGICFLLVAVSLLFPLEKGRSGSGWLYYIGIFTLNGLSGLIAKVYNDAPFPKGSAADFSILTALVSATAPLVILLMVGYRPQKLSWGSLLATVGHGAFNRFANFLLLIALVHLPASAQYPMITGGVMVLSTVLCLFTPNKPKLKEWIAVALSFAGIMALVLIP